MKLNYLLPILLLFVITSCKNENKDSIVKTENISTETSNQKIEEEKKREDNDRKAKEERKLQIEKTEFYLKNSSITDENGITYKIKAEKVEVNREKKYQSPNIFFEDTNYVFVSSYVVEYKYVLTANGDIQDEFQFFGYSLESRRNDRNGFGEWCSDTYTYIPELSSDEYKKKKIAEYTGQNCGMGSEVNDKVRKERINAVKASGIIGDVKIPTINKSKKSEQDNSVNNKVEKKVSSESENAIPNNKLIITVDNLRVRTSPNLDAEKIENLPINTVVEYLNEKSAEKVTVKINDNDVSEYWYKIKTTNGNIGWIHGCCFNK